MDLDNFFVNSSQRDLDMPQGGHGKARKNFVNIIINSDDPDEAFHIVNVDNNPGIKKPPLGPEKNLVDPELSDGSLPALATVSIDKLQDAPALHGIKWKISALVPRKKTLQVDEPPERKHSSLFYLTSEPIALTVIAEDNSEHPKVTYHLRITSTSSQLKKQPSKRTNMAWILKLSQSLKFQDSIMDIVAHALDLSTLVSTYEDFQVLFTIARKVSDPTPLLSDEDYEIMIDNVGKAKDPAVSLFICALKVCQLVIYVETILKSRI